MSLRLVFDQLFHVPGVGVVIFGRIEFCRHALDQLQGKIDFVRNELFVDRQAELVSRADFRGEAECIEGQGIALGFQYAEASRFIWRTTDDLSTPSRWPVMSLREQPSFTIAPRTKLH